MILSLFTILNHEYANIDFGATYDHSEILGTGNYVSEMVMYKEKAQAFFEKKKAETESKMKGKKGDGKTDTSKMPEGLRKHFEKKNK